MKNEVLVPVDLTEDEIQKVFKKLSYFKEKDPDFEDIFNFIYQAKPFRVNAVMYNNLRFILNDDPDMRLFFSKFFRNRRARKAAGYNAPTLSVSMGLTITFHDDERTLEYSYLGNSQLVKEYVRDQENFFFDFDIEQLPAITQAHVDAAFSVLEALLNGDLQNPEAWIIKCKDGFPYKTLVRLTDKIICKFDTSRMQFIDDIAANEILEEHHLGRYETADLNTYIDCLNKWGIAKVDKSRVFERAIMQARMSS